MIPSQLHDIGLIAANAMSQVIIARIKQQQFMSWNSEDVARAIVNAYTTATGKTTQDLQ